MAVDFRYQIDALNGLNYAICGLGNSVYADNFNKVSITLDKSLASKQANRVAPLYCCDENTVNSKHGGLEGDVAFWQNNFFEKLEHFVNNLNKPVDETANTCCQSGSATGAGSCCKSKNKDSSEKACCKTKANNENEKEDRLG